MNSNKNIHRWNKWAQVYDRLIAPAETVYADLYLNIVKTIDYTDKVLELATGSGMVSLSVSPYCKSIDAVDHSKSMIDTARHNKSFSKYQNVNFSVSNAEAMPCDDDTYDVVILSNALHVLENPEYVMHEIKRVLKPGGKLIAANFLHREKLRSQMIIKSLSCLGYPVYRTFDESSYHNYLSQHDFTLKKCKVIEGIIPLAYVEASFENDN